MTLTPRAIAVLLWNGRALTGLSRPALRADFKQ